MKSAETIVEEILSKQPRNYEITREECIEIATQSYNKAISDAIDLFYNYWQCDDTVTPSNTKEFAGMLEKLIKPSQPNQ